MVNHRLTRPYLGGWHWMGALRFPWNFSFSSIFVALHLSTPVAAALCYALALGIFPRPLPFTFHDVPGKLGLGLEELFRFFHGDVTQKYPQVHPEMHPLFFLDLFLPNKIRSYMGFWGATQMDSPGNFCSSHLWPMIVDCRLCYFNLIFVWWVFKKTILVPGPNTSLQKTVPWVCLVLCCGGLEYRHRYVLKDQIWYTVDLKALTV